MGIPRLIAWLAVLCLICSWSDGVLSMALGRIRSSGAPGGDRFLAYESSIIVVLRFLGLAAALSAGLLAVFGKGFKTVTRSGRIGWVLAVLSSLIWMVASYELIDVREIILGPTSPIIWLSLIAVFAGALPATWTLLDRVIKTLYLVTIPLAIWSIVRSRGYWRCDGLNPVVESALLLTWFSAYLWLVSPSSSVFGQGLRFVGTALAFGAAVCSHSRGWVLQLVLMGLCVLYGNLRFRKGDQRLMSGRRMGLMVIAIGLTAVGVVKVLQPTVTDKLVSRLTEDTSAGQSREVLTQVAPGDLLLGKGPRAAYRFGSTSPYHFSDNGYIWILLLAGLPMLAAYSLLIILPGLALLFKARDYPTFGIGAVLLMWTFALAGVSTFNGLNYTLQSYFIVFLAGFCHLKLRSGDIRSRAAPGEPVSL
jgi:hypothetical protein